MKQCTKCKLNKSLDSFHISNAHANGRAPTCKTCRIIITKEFYQINKERIKKRTSGYYHSHKEQQLASQLQRQRERYKTDPLYVLKRRLRNRMYYALKNKGWNRTNKLNQYLGCTYPELLTHIQSRFLPNMTWQNYGKWHLDHIIPLNSANSPETLYKLCHYSNITPLWALDNIKKGAKQL